MPIAESAPAPPARHPRAPAPLLSMDDGDADDGPRARMEGTGRQYAPFAGSFEGAPEPKARELMPRLWRRFKQQKEGGVPADELPISGANITLEDLAIRSEDEPQTDPGTDLDEALQAGRPISGWIGTPDPAKFAPGTNVLTAKELEEEASKGNVMYLNDWVKSLSSLSDEDKRCLLDATLLDWLDTKVFFPLEDGSKVSFLKVFQYVHLNPELKALVDSGRVVEEVGENDDPVAAQRNRELLQMLTGRSGDMWLSAPSSYASQMESSRVGEGFVWRRRPTRWLWGMDGKLDFTFGAYAEEAAVEKVMGPRWARKGSTAVLSSSEYARDVLEAGPSMGMTYIITAARDMELSEACSVWSSRLSEQLRRQVAQAGPSSGLAPPSSSSSGASSSGRVGDITEAVAPLDMQAFQQLGWMLAPQALHSQTKLLDASGTRVLSGSQLVVTTGPDGFVELSAMSPGDVRTRENYLIGSLHNEGLSRAINRVFLDDGAAAGSGQGGALELVKSSTGAGTTPDPDFVQVARYNLLALANGYRKGVVDPHVAPEGSPPYFNADLIPVKPSVFRLPRLGAATPAPLLEGLRVALVQEQLSSVVVQGVNAVGSLNLPASAPAADVLARQDAAASSAMAQALKRLGLSVQGWGQEAQRSAPAM